MINKKTNEIFQIDERLVDRRTCIEFPVLVTDLLKDLSLYSPHPELKLLALQYHKITQVPFLFNETVNCSKGGCILVLGHALAKNYASLSTELLGCLEVAFAPHRLYKETTLILFGEGLTLGFTEAELMRDWLLRRGVKNAI